MSEVLITVGLISYNAISTINRALNSALSQSWCNLEIVCVDDFSQDGTYEYLKSRALNEPLLRVYRNNVNLGVGFSRNRVIEESRGDFIVFFDDDDESIPERIEFQFNSIISYEKQYPEAKLIVCHTKRKVVYPDGSSSIHGTMGSKCMQNYKIAPNGKNVAMDVFLGGYVEDSGACPTCTQMARKTLYQKIGGFDDQFRRQEDTDLVVRLALAEGHFIGTSEALVIQYMTNSPDKSIEKEFFYNRLLIEKHKNLLIKVGHYQNCLDWNNFRHLVLAKNIRGAIKFAKYFIIKSPKFFIRKLLISIKNISININLSKFHRIS
jgi:glycosyltransferase involved in cell wall biosynthesis